MHFGAWVSSESRKSNGVLPQLCRDEVSNVTRGKHNTSIVMWGVCWSHSRFKRWPTTYWTREHIKNLDLPCVILQMPLKLRMGIWRSSLLQSEVTDFPWWTYMFTCCCSNWLIPPMPLGYNVGKSMKSSISSSFQVKSGPHLTSQDSNSLPVSK